MAAVDELTAEIRATVLRLVAEVCLHEHGATRRLGLGATDVRFLTLLDLHGPLTPGRLAALTGLSTGSVTGVIDRLERAGLVDRRRDGTDRRKVQVVAVPEATARLAAERHGSLDRLDAALQRRGPSELEVIARFLDDVVGRDAVGPLRRPPQRDAGPAGRGPR